MYCKLPEENCLNQEYVQAVEYATLGDEDE